MGLFFWWCFYPFWNLTFWSISFPKAVWSWWSFLFDMFNHQRLHHFHWFLLWFCITSPPWISKDLIIFIDFCCGFASLVFEVNHILSSFGMETLFTTLLNHQRFDHFHWFLLLFCITSPPWITKDLIIFIDFCCGFASLVFEINTFSCHLVWKLYLLPSWITKDLIIFIDFCCGFASLVFEINHALIPFGMETLFTTLLNHQRFDHFHWFLLLFCIASPPWITKDLIIFIGFCCCFASLVPPESPKIWSFSLVFAVVLHH